MCYNVRASRVLFFFILLCAVYQAGYVHADIAGPGWLMQTGEPVTHAESEASIGSDYIQNLNEINIRNYLAVYASNLINSINIPAISCSSVLMEL